MQVKLSPRIVVVVAAIALTMSVTYAGYFHDQSIKAVYSSFEPQIANDQQQISARDSTISGLNNRISQLEAAKIDG
ncbi:hypothetical protein E6H23_09770 [Candidatus Bathyarchaeota archaeon]|nr:MAG: hypothetical protein E6H23_09770 [Candidatus Bathyarchaeota archaeon]